MFVALFASRDCLGGSDTVELGGGGGGTALSVGVGGAMRGGSVAAPYMSSSSISSLGDESTAAYPGIDGAGAGCCGAA